MSAGVYPFSMADKNMKGLNALPGWRAACVARFHLLCLKLRPPTIALTNPVLTSMATTADCR